MRNIRPSGIVLIVAAFTSISAGCRSTGVGRSSPGLAEARRVVGHDAVTEFNQNRQAEKMPFYSYGSFMYGDHFPGLSEADVKLWIEGRRQPFTRMFQDDPAPFFIDAGFTMEEYWREVDEFLATYNRLVLASLKEGHNKSADSTPFAGTSAAAQPRVPASAASHL